MIKLKDILNEDTERGSIVWIRISGKGGYFDWFLKKIDSTHFSMANSEKVLKTNKSFDSHIAQHKHEAYYNDIKNWLHGKVTAAQLNGKKYTKGV